MIKRFIFIMLSALLLAGCASSPRKPMEDDTLDRLAALHQKVNAFRDILKDYETTLKLLDTRVQSFERRLDRMEAGGTPQASAPQPEPQPEPQEAAPAEPESSGPDISEFSIKVLSGTGDIGDARAISESLNAMGYDVKRVDMNPSRSTRNTVFYSAGLEGEAEALAMVIGEGTVTKPLSWKSSFDFIVVAGKK